VRRLLYRSCTVMLVVIGVVAALRLAAVVAVDKALAGAADDMHLPISNSTGRRDLASQTLAAGRRARMGGATWVMATIDVGRRLQRDPLPFSWTVSPTSIRERVDVVVRLAMQ
jgi:hypothetical protein